MRNVGVVDPYAISQKNKTLIDKENNMSRLIVKAWDVVDGVIDASRNTTNSTDEISPTVPKDGSTEISSQPPSETNVTSYPSTTLAPVEGSLAFLDFI